MPFERSLQSQVWTLGDWNDDIALACLDALQYLWILMDTCGLLLMSVAFNLNVFLLARNLPWSINEIVNQIMNQITNWNILESSIASSIGSWILISDAAA